jgi:transcriptional pleiotropic regulator of transition state genes
VHDSTNLKGGQYIMKNTGIVRKLDELGRIVIPKEIRTTMEIAEGCPLEIHVDGEEIILKKYIKEKKVCAHCQSISELISMDGTYICLPCYYRLSQKVKNVERRSPVGIF